MKLDINEVYHEYIIRIFCLQNYPSHLVKNVEKVEKGETKCLYILYEEM